MTRDDRPEPRRATLADGREILYFDDPGGPRPTPPPDRRTLPSIERFTELRCDPLLDEWVIVATHRQDRTFLPAEADCPLCPSRGGRLTEIPAHDYDVVAFENRFPSLPAGAERRAKAGRCEVVCYTADHDASFAGLADERLLTVGRAWVHRTLELGRLPGVEYVFVFENRGQAIGVTLDHPHGQVYAYPFVPPHVERMLAVGEAHTGCIGCDLLADELADGRRVVAARPGAVSYVPRAARWPFEVHVVPRRHCGALSELAPDELHDVLALQADAIHRLDGLFDHRIPYMAGWLQAPPARPEGLHLRLQLVSPQRDAGKLKFLAGSESLMGAFINDVRPEMAAERLRSVPARRPG